MKCDKKTMLLYAVTDRAWVGKQNLYEQVESALKGGVTCVQLREKELDEFISYIAKPPVLDSELEKVIAEDRKMLAGEFCRSCGYCLPCPAEIDIPQCARMSLMLRRAPSEAFLTPQWNLKMEKIADCINCGSCSSKCPYQLDTPSLLRRNLEDYRNVISGKVSVK